MKNVLFEQKKIKLCNKQHFVEKETEVMQQALEMQYISLSDYIKWISRCVFLLVTQVNTIFKSPSHLPSGNSKWFTLQNPICISFTHHNYMPNLPKPLTQHKTTSKIYEVPHYVRKHTAQVTPAIYAVLCSALKKEVKFHTHQRKW